MKDGDFKILDNYISKVNQESIKKIVTDYCFPWYWNPTTAGNLKTKNQKYQFTHTLFTDGKIISDYFNSICSCLNYPEFNTHQLVRIKLNLNVPYKNNKIVAPHIDTDIKGAISYIYYCIDSDGPTTLYENWWKKRKVIPKQGRVVRLKSSMYHTGATPKKSDRRIIINTIFIPNKHSN
jgi:hypothetical protein